MKKNLIFLLFLLASIFSYSDVKWNGEDGRIRIIYKIVDPLIVTVDEPKKMVVTASQKNFTYSNVSQDRKALTVKVNAPYNEKSVDPILREIYKNVYFELQNKGEFDLKHETQPENIIKGKGYFIDPQAQITRENKETFYKKEFASQVSGDKFYTTTQVDADFTMPKDNMPMGVYRGTLYLNVWFGGSIQ